MKRSHELIGYPVGEGKEPNWQGGFVHDAFFEALWMLAEKMAADATDEKQISG